MKVAVFIAHADNAEDANAQCKRLPAYRQILVKYPSSTWNRRHLKTRRHSGVAEGIADGPGAWMVEFEVEEKK